MLKGGLHLLGRQWEICAGWQVWSKNPAHGREALVIVMATCDRKPQLAMDLEVTKRKAQLMCLKFHRLLITSEPLDWLVDID